MGTKGPNLYYDEILGGLVSVRLRDNSLFFGWFREYDDETVVVDVLEYHRYPGEEPPELGRREVRRDDIYDIWTRSYYPNFLVFYEDNDDD